MAEVTGSMTVRIRGRNPNRCSNPGILDPKFEHRRRRHARQEERINSKTLQNHTALVRVHDQITRPPIANFWHETPLQSAREAGASPASQTRLLHLLNNPVGALDDQVLGPIPVTPRLGTLQEGIVTTVYIRKDAILPGEDSNGGERKQEGDDWDARARRATGGESRDAGDGSPSASEHGAQRLPMVGMPPLRDARCD